MGFVPTTKHTSIWLCLINEVTKGIYNDMYTIGIFMYISKAFDTIDHGKLLQKWYYYGV